jgi:Domain of unknown function (DUF222)
MREALAQLERAAELCLPARAYALSAGDLVECLDRLQVLVQRMSAVQLALVREADGRAIATEHAAPSTAAWLRERWRISPSAAARMVRLAGLVDTDGGQALSDGRVNVEQLAAIDTAVAAIPAEHQPAAGQYLVEQAAVFGPRELGRLGHRVFEVVAPAQAQQRELAGLQRAEDRAWRDRALWITDLPGQQRVRLSGVLCQEDAAVVRAALDPLCAPRREGAGQPETRSPGQRRADALIEVCRLTLAAGELPDNGGDRPQVVITIPFAALRDQVGAGMLRPSSLHGGTDTVGDRSTIAGQRLDAGLGHPLSERDTASGSTDARAGVLDDAGMLTPSAVRRLACDAAILPAVLGGQGQVLDVGRQRRTFTGPLRRALVLRDGGCAFPGCDRPPRWCDGHHIQHWADGGGTRLDNAVLLCGHHHRVIHQDQWQVRVSPRDGLPEFTPPADLDPDQQPRRNTYHRRQ